MRLIRSFVAVLSTRPQHQFAVRSWIQSLPEWCPTHVISSNRKLELAFTDSKDITDEEPHQSGQRLNLLVGDDAEWEETHPDSCMANAAFIEWDPTQNSLRVVSSIVGLPPIFVYRGHQTMVVTSELHLLRGVKNLRLEIDPQAAVELITVGQPLGHRTLFKNVTLMPGGHTLRIDAQEKVDLAVSWRPPDQDQEKRASFSLDLQALAFKQAVERLQLSDTVFSLTGGLDTRAILPVLLDMGVKPNTCTISGGSALSLDARQASTLCRAYGFKHTVVTLGDNFVRDLPSHVMEAATLSGGLSSVEQAHEIYFHRQLQGLGSRRLSGYLGNQIGRLGVERVSVRKADSRVLHDTVTAKVSTEFNEHWLTSTARRLHIPLLQLLIQHEVLFSSVGSYSIGHHFMVQQSPYANRFLIETSFGVPGSDNGCTFVPNHARLQDLRHRFLGVPRSQSFQRRLIEGTGGPVADCPINWGWRAKGGVSIMGLGWGMLAFLDAASFRLNFAPKFSKQCLRLLRANGLHEISSYREWFDTVLREFVNDTLRSREVKYGGLFNASAIVKLLDEHYHGGRSHYDTLVATLDLALAQQLFTTAGHNIDNDHLAA